MSTQSEIKIQPADNWPVVQIGDADFATPPAVAKLVRKLRFDRAFATGLLKAVHISLVDGDIEMVRQNIRKGLKTMGEVLP